MQSIMKLNIFFDVDGTLLPVGHDIPQDAVNALYKAKEQGHRLFFCTGRSLSEIPQRLQDLPFDGGVFSAGAIVKIGNKTIYNTAFSPEKRKAFFSIVDKYKILWILQSEDKSYLTQGTINFFSELTEKYFSKQIEVTGLEFVTSYPADQPLIKYVIMSPDGKIPEARKELNQYFDTVNNPLGLPQENICEGGTKGITKASGIQHVIDYYGDDISSTVGIGDGENDMEMVKTCHLGIAMGNAVQCLKDEANFITTDILSGGIANAIEHAIKTIK